MIGKWEGGETVPLPSPAPPHCFFNFGAIAPLWLQRLLDCFSFHDPAPARYPVVQPVLIGQPWLLESGNSSSSCGISITRDYSGFLQALLLEMSLSRLWLFTSFSTIAISSPYSVPALKDLACTCLFS